MNSSFYRAALSRRGRVALPLLVVAIASGGGFWLGILRHAANGNLGLVARESSLDFGEPWECSDFPWTLTLENPTAEAIKIDELQTSCGCTIAVTKHLSIKPGGAEEVRLRLDLSPRQPDDGSLPSRQFSVVVTPIFIRDGDALAGKGWTVRGLVRSALRPVDNQIAFGRTARLVSGGPRETLSLVAMPLMPLSAVEAFIEPPLATAAVSRATNKKDFLIEVTSKNNAAPGAFTCFLHLRPLTADGERLPAVRVKVEGSLAAPVVAVPDTVSFGLRSQGETAEAGVRLESPLNQAFTIERIDVHDARGIPLTVNADAGGALRLRKSFSISGKYSAQVRITIRRQRGEPFELLLQATAYVRAAENKEASQCQ